MASSSAIVSFSGDERGEEEGCGFCGPTRGLVPILPPYFPLVLIDDTFVCDFFWADINYQLLLLSKKSLIFQGAYKQQSTSHFFVQVKNKQSVSLERIHAIVQLLIHTQSYFDPTTTIQCRCPVSRIRDVQEMSQELWTFQSSGCHNINSCISRKKVEKKPIKMAVCMPSQVIDWCLLLAASHAGPTLPLAMER